MLLAFAHTQDISVVRRVYKYASQPRMTGRASSSAYDKLKLDYF